MMQKIQLLAFFHILFFTLNFLSVKATLTDKLSQRGIKILNQTNFRKETGINLSNFNQKLKGDSDYMIMFYADWCGFSKNFSRDIYVKLKNKTKDIGFNITFAAVQCPSSRKICNKLEIFSYPKLFYFPNKGGKYRFPKKPKTKKNVLQFIKRSHNGTLKKATKQAVEQSKQAYQKKEKQLKQSQEQQIQDLPITSSQDIGQQEEIQQLTQAVYQQRNKDYNLKQQKAKKQQIKDRPQEQVKDIQIQLKLLKPSTNQMPKQQFLLQSTHLKQKVLLLICGLLIITIIPIFLLKKRNNLTRMVEKKELGQNVYVPNILQTQQIESQRAQMGSDKNQQQNNQKQKLQISS